MTHPLAVLMDQLDDLLSQLDVLTGSLDDVACPLNLLTSPLDDITLSLGEYILLTRLLDMSTYEKSLPLYVLTRQLEL